MLISRISNKYLHHALKNNSSVNSFGFYEEMIEQLASVYFLVNNMH